ncbi:Hpt domain-containing protein [uncultured Sulfurimonas sp.]|jgi:HPt (histidine-containing phosphotransfer) domain-containing protein|uniref:Hpt domain-containing protein n=1 Tax=uncultured Sulfurimonas sp. TaxID=291845 RepID=UPI0032B23437
MPITNPNYSDLNHEDMAASIGLKAKHIPMLIGSFLEETGVILETIASAIASTDYAAIKLSAHSVKGSASDTSFEYSAYLTAVKSAVATITF